MKLKFLLAAIYLVILAAISVFIFKRIKTPAVNNVELSNARIPTQTASPSVPPEVIPSLDPTQLQEYYNTYKNPYVIHLRKALDGYLDGSNYGMDDPSLVIESSTRDGYIDGLSSFDKSYYQSKFIIYSIVNSIVGGKEIAIIFQDKPDKIFRALVYKLSTGTYDLRGFSQDLQYTPEKMAQIQKDYKVFLDDKNHAI